MAKSRHWRFSRIKKFMFDHHLHANGEKDVLILSLSEDAILRRLRERLSAAPPPLLGGRPAAVLMPLMPLHGRWHFLFTVRPLTMPTHAGDICFPGGGLRAGEDAQAAALREAEEEVGLAPEEVTPLGFLPPQPTGSGHVIAPLLALVAEGARPRPCPREVAEIFTAPLSHFLDPAHYGRERIVVRGRERTYWVVRWRDRRIWGATAAMLKRLQELAGDEDD